MSLFDPAVEKTLISEGGFFWNHTTGEVVNMGITLKTLRSLGVLKTSGPPLESDIAFVKSLTEDEAKDIYQDQYWDPLHLELLTSQEVANKIFDLAVNTGWTQATKILQRALRIPDDGILGPHTVAAANAADPVNLLADIRTCGTQFYCELAQSKPELADNLDGWLKRLNA